MTLIAVIVSQEEQRRRLGRILRTDGFDTLETDDGVEALGSTFRDRPDAALVDSTMLALDGVELVHVLRVACDIPIIALLPDLASSDVIRALDAGADDVVERQCSAIELFARIRAAIRRYQRRPVHLADVRQACTGNLVIDRDAHQATKCGQVVSLTRTEYRIVDSLAAHLDEIIPHRELLSTVWGEGCIDDTHYLRTYMGYLRCKLEDDPAMPRYLLNEWGIGYRLARIPVPAPEMEMSAGTPAAR